MPFEYCMYGPSPSVCAERLLAADPALHAALYAPAASASTAAAPVDNAGDATAAVDGDATAVVTTGDADTAAATADDNDADGDDDAAAPAAAAAAPSSSKKAKKKQVNIVTSQRQKRKHITAVTGLEAYNGTKLAAVAKVFSKKFACQASATKDQDELLVQGDFGIEVAEALVADYGVKKADIKIVQQKRA